MWRTTNERYLTSPDDIAANRSGTLTDAQRRQAMRLNLGGGALAFVIISIVAGLFAFGFVAEVADNSEAWRLLIPVAIFVLAGVPIGLIVLMQIVRLVLTRQDLEANDVQQADGVVAWRRYRYAAEFPGRAFWTNNSVTSLAPGPYRFYYLPRSGYVLSAEKLGGMMAATGSGELAGLTQVLGSVIGFSAGDLEANRDGRLGGGQVARMALAIAGLGVLALIILGFCGFMLFTVVSDVGGDLPIALLIIGAVGIVGPLVIGWSIVKLGLDLLGGRVEMVQGPVQRTATRAGRNTTYHYHVEGQKFTVSLRAYQALVGGKSYKVYYGPRSKRLVGLESKGE